MTAIVISTLLPISVAVAQNGIGLQPGQLGVSAQTQSDGSADTSLFTPVLNLDRNVENKDLQGLYRDETINVNLGMQINPTDSLSFSADAWRLEVKDLPAGNSVGQSSLTTTLPQIYLEDMQTRDFTLERPFQSPNVEASGLDLGASYVWNTDNLGQFTLSTTASYVYDFNQSNQLAEISALVGSENQLSNSPEIQGSLTLTWQIGNHSATAVTNYFDSFKEIGELNIEDINELVDNITTVDLQYGYTLRTGKKDSAIISFDIGIRNIFDEKTTRILNQNSRVVDQNGRVAYGSIKYQF